MMDRITANIPPGVTLTSFAGQETPPAPAPVVAPPVATEGSSGGSAACTETTTTQPAPPPPPTISGTITFQGTAKDYPTVASWIDAMGKVPQIANVYVTSATRVPDGANGAGGGLTFTATAEVSTAAQSNRLDEYAKAAK
jgi:hypothetical protein